MVLDRLKSIGRYHSLDEALARLQDVPAEPIPAFYGYRVSDSTVVFTVERKRLIASTTWRENPGSREASAAAAASEGDFVLFLPGEPYLVKAEDEDTEASMRIL